MFRLPVEAKVPVAGVYISALNSDTMQPTTSTTPSSTAVAARQLPASLPIVAMPRLEELQVTDWRTCVLLLLKVPVAMNCCVVPSDRVALGGVTAIDTTWFSCVTVHVAVAVDDGFPAKSAAVAVS